MGLISFLQYQHKHIKRLCYKEAQFEVPQTSYFSLKVPLSLKFSLSVWVFTCWVRVKYCARLFLEVCVCVCSLFSAKSFEDDKTLVVFPLFLESVWCCAGCLLEITYSLIISGHLWYFHHFFSQFLLCTSHFWTNIFSVGLPSYVFAPCPNYICEAG